VFFTQLAIENKYVCPELDESFELDIKNGRHPLSKTIGGMPYIANDVFLTQQLIMTGPICPKSAITSNGFNSAVSSNGEFVPADSVRMGIVDKIFTRVGASDNISMGESTLWSK
jgi:DNA mismatch repair protein MutS